MRSAGELPTTERSPRWRVLVSSRFSSADGIELPLYPKERLDFGRQLKGDTRELKKINQAGI
jgi:hypothetical protein